MSPARQWGFWALGLVVLVLLLFMLRGVLLPFVAGIAIAYLLDPVADFLQKKGMSRTLATLAIIAAFLLIFIAVLALLLPVLQGQIERFPGYIEKGRELLVHQIAVLQDRISPEDMERIREGLDRLLNKLGDGVGKLASRVISGGLVFLNLMSLIVITPIVAFYIILDWDRLVATVDDLLPREHAPVIREQFGKIDKKLAGFVRGQAMVAAIQGVFYAVALTIAGLDFGLVIGLGAGFASFIPFVGSVGGLIVSVGLATIQFGELVPVLIVAAIFLVGQVIEGNFLTPKLVGDRVGLHPVWMIFALLAGGALLGLLGLLLAVPVAAVISVLAAFGVERYRASRLFLGNGPAPAGPPDSDQE